MDTAKREDLLAGQGTFGTSEPEGQRNSADRRIKRNKTCKIITGVLLLCLLVALLVVIITLRKRTGLADGELWIHDVTEEIQQPQCPPGFSRPPVILVSMDGFRAEYLKDQTNPLPNINKLRNMGTTTTHMRPVYPTKTFPNHYSIVTGLYPESHGIVDNKMYDVTTNTFFSLKTDEKFNPKWYQGEPVWITAMNHKLKTGTFFWPGSDVAINGTFPTYYKIFDMSFPYESRVSTVLEWLSLPQEKRPDFYTLYFDEPDSSGHRYGPGSKQVREALKKVDGILGILMDGLTRQNLHKCVNLIISSDHGMEEATCEKAAYVSTYQQDMSAFTIIQGAAGRIRPTRLPEDYFTFDYEGLVKNLSCRTADQPMRPYLKENLPKRMHFANNKRIERGHLYMKEGWQAGISRDQVKYCAGGFHGSDNVFNNMQAIFIGYGPGFKDKHVVPPFENIELYNLMCDLLGIRPAPNNGTHGSLNHLLKKPFHRPVHPATLSLETQCVATNFVSTDNLQCNCSSQTRAQEAQMNSLLNNSTFNNFTSLRRQHQPFGTPAVVQSDVSFCLLHHLDYINGYSKDRHMPLWVSYSIHPLVKMEPFNPNLEECIRADVRVPPSASQLCLHNRNDPHLTYGLLHPPYLKANGPESDSLLTSNMVPMFPAFRDVWNFFHNSILQKYSYELNEVNIISGPIFDENFDGHADPVKKIEGNEAPIPTHFFIILTTCQNSSLYECDGSLLVRAFILPHRPDYSEVCQTSTDLGFVEKWMQFHTARVRDIELLTGLSFYHDRLSVEETLQLKTSLHTE